MPNYRKQTVLRQNITNRSYKKQICWITSDIKNRKRLLDQKTPCYVSHLFYNNCTDFDWFWKEAIAILIIIHWSIFYVRHITFIMTLVTCYNVTYHILSHLMVRHSTCYNYVNSCLEQYDICTQHYNVFYRCTITSKMLFSFFIICLLSISISNAYRVDSETGPVRSEDENLSDLIGSSEDRAPIMNPVVAHGYLGNKPIRVSGPKTNPNVVMY